MTRLHLCASGCSGSRFWWWDGGALKLTVLLHASGRLAMPFYCVVVVVTACILSHFLFLGTVDGH